MDQPVETWTIRVDADLSDLQMQMARASSEGKQLGRALTTAFQGIAIQGKSVTDTLRTLALSLSEITLKAAFKPFEQMIGGLFQGLIGGGLNPGAGGLPLPFAAGGVISSPITFPLSGGATGIAGERGAEAIMPLARGPDGRLGIKSAGAGGAVSVTFNVTTPDADSFRRTETQVAAMLSRAIANGQRNL